MEEREREHLERAISALEDVIRTGPRAPHEDVAIAVRCIAAFRNSLIENGRRNGGSQDLLNQANALLSLAYGTEAPLAGFHLHRAEQVRDGLKRLLASA